MTADTEHTTRSDQAEHPDDLAAWRHELLQTVWGRQRERIQRRLQTLGRALDALSENTLEPDLQDAATRAAHTLAGSLAIFGFTEAARTSRALEQRLPTAKPQDAPRLHTLVHELQDELERPPY